MRIELAIGTIACIAVALLLALSGVQDSDKPCIDYILSRIVIASLGIDTVDNYVVLRGVALPNISAAHIMDHHITTRGVSRIDLARPHIRIERPRISYVKRRLKV